jgi:hypothetical protein
MWLLDWTLDIEVFDDGDEDGVEDGMGKDKDGQKRGETDVIYKDQSLSCLAHGMTTRQGVSGVSTALLAACLEWLTPLHFSTTPSRLEGKNLYPDQ